MKQKHYYSLKAILILSFIFVKGLSAQVTLIENTTITEEALFYWKVDDATPYHYGAAINPHGNCVKVVNGYVFYTWYRGGFTDRTLMVSRKKINEGAWKHVALPGKQSLVGGLGDTHLTTNIGVCPIDGTVHIMYDHHNEDLNYIVSEKNIAFASDADFNADNFLPQQDYLVSGTKVTGVTYPKMINNDQGELFFERRNGSAVGGDMMISYYDGTTWSNEIIVLQGKGAEVSQGERNYCYGKPYLFNGNFYYVYSVRWAESPTTLNEGVYIVNLGARMNQTATTVDGRSFNLPIIDHAPFLIADPRSVPGDLGWAGGPDAAMSPKDDIYLKISPKNTTHYNYLRKEGETEFAEDRGKGSPGIFYGNRMFKCITSGGVLTVQSCLAGSYEWRTDYTLNTGIDVQKSQVEMDNGKIVAIFAEKKASDKVPIHCYVFDITKPEYTPQTITFGALAAVSESAADFSLSATSSSGLPVSYTSSNTDVAKIVDDNTIHIVGVGTCNIIASQAGNGEYDSAADVSQSLEVTANTSKTNQTISFTLAETTHTWGNADVTLNGTASSGLAVQYESSDTNVAVINQGVLHVKRAGSTVIRALQLGDDTYNAAPVVKYTLSVPKQKQVITFQEIPELNSGAPTYTFVANSNNPNANLRFVCPNNQVGIVWGNTITETLTAGSAKVTVSDIGDDYFEPASAEQTLTVKPTTFTIPQKIEAEWSISKQGVNVTRWSNSIFYLNAWAANDYAEYSINVPTDGTYPLDLRAANPTGTGKVKIMSGSTELATVSFVSTSSLTVFKTTSAEVQLTKGVQSIKVVGVVGGFNFDWLQFNQGDVPIDTTRSLGFKNISEGEMIDLGTNLTIEANVGSAFREVTLWSDDVNLGTLTNAPYTWSSHEILTDMREPAYTFKLVAVDSVDAKEEVSITVFTPAINALSENTSLHVSFEDEVVSSWETDGSDYGVIPTIIESANTRAGSKVMAFEYPSGTSGHHVQNIIDKVVVPNQHYFHMIAYSATSDIAYGQTYPTAQLGDWKPTPAFTGHAENLAFERKVTSRQNTNADSLNCYPRLRSKANGGACVVYYDDIVLYSDINEQVDLVPPTAVADIILSKPTAESVQLNWTEGVDSLTRIVSTLILRTSNFAAESPVLFPQVAYAELNRGGGVAEIGDWNVIATVPGGTYSYVDSTISVNDSCKYALVHKDLAYNYSTPVIIEHKNNSTNPNETEALSDKLLVYINFEDENLENWKTEGSDANFNSSIVNGTNTRAGEKVLALYYSGATPEHHLLNKIDKIAVPNQQYFHIIAYAATSNVASGQTCPSGKLGSWIPTPQFADFNQALTFERKTATHQNLEADSLNCYPLLISMANGGACAVYYDDIILYADTNAIADIVSPTMAENLAINKQTTGVVELSWTEGMDSLTGIKETLVLRTHSLADENPTLYPQVAYAPLIETGVVNSIGSWEVIASIPVGTTVYADNALTANESCKYAIVHKDVVYNYSIPSVIENKADAGTGVSSELLTSFKCYGVKGAIKISDLSRASYINIYNSAGVKVFTQKSSSSSLSVPLTNGLYIVNVSGLVTKVIVE